MKNYTFYGILFTLSAYLCFLSACGEGDIVDLSSGDEWDEIKLATDNLTKGEGLIAGCIDKPDNHEICKISSSSEATQEQSSSSSNPGSSTSTIPNPGEGDNSSSSGSNTGGNSSSSGGSGGNSSSSGGGSSPSGGGSSPSSGGGADYTITCSSGGNLDATSCGGSNTFTLQVGECAEISVNWTNNDYKNFDVVARCKALNAESVVSFTLSLNGTNLPVASGSNDAQSTPTLGKMAVVGNNEFGMLCLEAMSGTTGVECSAPVQ